MHCSRAYCSRVGMVEVEYPLVSMRVFISLFLADMLRLG